MRAEMNMLDKIADPLKKIKFLIRQKAIEAKEKRSQANTSKSGKQ